MMSSTSFSAPTGPFPYEARAGATTDIGIHPHHQQPLPMDNTITEPIILDSTFPISDPSQPLAHNPYHTTTIQQDNDISQQFQNLQSLLTQALSERDTARLSLATLRNELYNARQVEKRLRIERDEARAQVSFLKKERIQVKQTETRLRRERDEARLALAQAVRGGKLKGLVGVGKGKAQGGMTGIELLLGSHTGPGARKTGMGAALDVGGSNIKGMGSTGQMPGVSGGVTAQFGGQEQGQSSPGAQTGAVRTTGMEGHSGAGGITDFGPEMFGADMDEQLEEFLKRNEMMHGVNSRETSPIQQVPTPPGAGMGYGYEASHGVGGPFETIQS